MIIETDRLTIRSFVESDIPRYAAIVADRAVTRFIGDGSPHTYEEAAAYVERCIRSESEGSIARYAVILRETGELIGFCGFGRGRGCIDFGWRYAKHAWGNGYATEAAAAVLDYGINTLKLSGIVARSAVENAGSIRVMEKIGLEFDAFGIVHGRRTAFYRQPSADQP
jgi:ribosomal-protein-alanine N-acetyltransferase